MENKNFKLWQKNYKYLNKENKTKFNNVSENNFNDYFGDELSFGTAGLRGLMGIGTSKMNIYTIRRVTLAYAKYLVNKFDKKVLLEKGVLIGRDNRHNSEEFAKEAASILSQNNIKVLLFPDNEVTPTPLVSFATKHLNCVGGIVITASHNPKDYNGYKIYDSEGCQLLPKDTNIITSFYENIQDEAFQAPYNFPNVLISYIKEDVKNTYKELILKMQFFPKKDKNITIVYSNFNGAGKNWTPEILREAGFNVILVQEQYDYDPDFTTCPKPNPEILSNYDLCIKYAKENNADLIIVNDPDVDRMGIGVKHQDEYILLTGNETAPIFLDYWLSQKIKHNKMPKNPVMYNTFVTGTLGDKICEKYNVEVIKTLTGFKWIGSQIPIAQKIGKSFVFGFEEAYGYVLNSFSKDKDGIQASLVIAEACWYYKEKGLNFIELLEKFYKEFGYYYCFTPNYEFVENSHDKYMKSLKIYKEKQEQIFKDLRKNPIKSLNNIECIKVEDYNKGLYNMPAQNLLKYYFKDGSWLAVRGSGTEPKVKFYYVAVDKNSMRAAEKKQKLMHEEIQKKYIYN